MMTKTNTINAIDAVLAQTQCRLCEYDDCRAYAKAIVHEGERIDRCLPGGEKTLTAIANITQQNPEPYRDDLRKNTKAITLAVIREHECIGCTKCIQACPVDAIIGSGKHMHTVMTDLCNGCELCIPPCPVDCIDTKPHPHYADAHQMAAQSQARYRQHQARQQQQKAKKPFQQTTLATRKAAIQAALARVKSKGKKA